MLLWSVFLNLLLLQKMNGSIFKYLNFYMFIFSFRQLVRSVIACIRRQITFPQQDRAVFLF